MEENTTKRFDEASKSYRTNSIIFRAESAKKVSELISPGANDVIVDFGCGPGMQIIELSSKIKYGFGFDISPGMVAQAKENKQEYHCSNIDYFVYDFLNFDAEFLKEKQVNKIISNYAFHHLSLDEKNKAIDKIINASETVTKIVIGDLLFFDNPDKYPDEYSKIGYHPGCPCGVDDTVNLFNNTGFTVKVYQLHPLVGIVAAQKIN